MRALVLLSVFFVLALLLAGCAQTPSPPAASPPGSGATAPPASGAVVPTVPASDNNAPPAAPAGTNNTAGANPSGTPANPPAAPGTCTLTLDKKQIVAGSSAVLTMRANPGPGVTATYLCGSDVKTLGTNGLFNDWKVCQFNQSGNITVWMKLNNQICASAPLEVLSSSNPGLGKCWITPGSRNYSMADGLRTYAATLNYANYSPAAVLSWDCAWKSYQQSIGSGGINAPNYVSGSIVINCQYAFDPGRLDALPVHMNADYCGDLLK